MIMVAMSYFCRQNMSQISLKIVANCSHPSEILAYRYNVETLSHRRRNRGGAGGGAGARPPE